MNSSKQIAFTMLSDVNRVLKCFAASAAYSLEEADFPLIINLSFRHIPEELETIARFIFRNLHAYRLTPTQLRRVAPL